MPLTRRAALAGAAAASLLPAARALSGRMQTWKLATSRRTGTNDLAPAPDGGVWFTAQASGHLGWFDPKTGQVTAKESPRGRGPYGICSTPSGEVWWCSLAGSFIARIDRRTGESHVAEPPTSNQGARRVDSANVRQILGRKGEVWLPESGTEHITVIRTT